MELNLSTNNATFGGDVNAISYTLTGGFQITHPGSGYAQFSNWVKLGTSGFFSDTNSAHIYPNNASYGSWRMDGTRNGWGGIEFANNGVSLMMGSDTVGFHQNTNGWLFRVHNGSGFIYKGSWGGGTAATILESSNYNSYAPTLTGTGASGTWSINITGSSTSCSGNSASASYAPEVSLTGLGTSTVNVNNPRTAVYRNENGAGAALAYAPVLHLGGGDTMWQIQGTYGSSGNGTLYFRQGYNGSWGTWLTMLSSANYNSYSPTLTGTGASGSWGINITGNAGSVTYLPNRTDSTAYPVVWGAAYTNGSGTIAYSCAAVTIQSSTGILAATSFSGAGTGLTGTAASLTAGAVTNGVYTTGNQTIAGTKTFSSAIVATNAAKAWVHFNGTGNVGINANYNVSSITDNGTGDYTVNFTSAFVDTNYVVAGTATIDYTSAQSLNQLVLAVARQTGAQSTGSCRLATEYIHGAALYDAVAVRAVFYR
jgi:hypothetical protein